MKAPALALALTAAIALLGGTAGAALNRGAQACGNTSRASDVRRLERLLSARRDVLGERLLASRGGPSLAAAERLLPPLLYAVGHGGRPLTASGVYYLPFTLPVSVGGSRGFGLHVADGSEIIVRRVNGPHLDVGVGRGGRERFGSCLRRLSVPHLAEGYLPILQVAYRDGLGTRYLEESFVGRLPGSPSLVSFVRITADGGNGAAVRLASSRGTTLRWALRGRSPVEMRAAFVHNSAGLVQIDASRYEAARASVVAFWRRLLPAEPTFDVPEPSVVEAERALEVQELEMTWRYSVGNVYEELSYAEALDVAQVMAGYGYRDVARQILRYTLRRLPARFTYWRTGERMVAGAQYFRLTGDTAYVSEELPALRFVVSRLERGLLSSPNGLLPRERYSSDIADMIYSLQGQTLVWQGLLAISRMWVATGQPELAARARSLGLRLEHGLRGAVRRSQRRLPDGSLFVPADLLDGSAPFDRLTDSRNGTYWNLVAPYALASGFFRPGGVEAKGLIRYLLNHGSRLLGLVRAGAYRLADAESSASGTDQVYGVNVARFLADNDEPDQLVLSLYGTLAAALTPGTYVTGEAATITPYRRTRFRAMYLPPNNGGAGAFLETLRVMLVHEARGPEGTPTGLELGFAAPRAWLLAGRRTAVHKASTSFGPVSYSIIRAGDVVRVDVTPPPRIGRARLMLRLRLPAGEHIGSVRLAGRPVAFDRRTGTIDLSGPRGPMQLTVAVWSGA
jgi:hypothetical protein